MPYETDIRVPLYIRGPNVQTKEQHAISVITLDLAPTILDIAGLNSEDYDMDGMSLYPLLKNETQYTRDSFMIEYHGEGKVGNYQKCGDEIEDMYNLAICEPEWGCKCQDSRNNTYNCLRTMTNTENTLFCAFEDDVGHVEFYNLEEDLYQLHNLYENVKIQEKYFDTLETLKTCKG